MSTKFGSSEKSKSRGTRSRGPTELVTIGGGTTGGGGSHIHSSSRTRTKSPFQRLDDAADDHDGVSGLDHGQRGYALGGTATTTTTSNKKTTVTTTMSTEYASSGEGDEVETMRTRSHGQEQYGKGFV